ncbi:MAG TPA: hypothetical protein VG847_01795 [Chitinophagaceae bacterium]|nr:hypothetical protein [Chitinophagaceae bacterium]
MNIAFQHLIPKDFNENSHVWIYQANRPFTDKEVTKVEEHLQNFVTSWATHGIPVRGFAKVLFSQFIIFMADETATGISGCSMDTTVRLLKSIEKEFLVSLFDRQILAFIIKDKIKLIPLSQVNTALDEKIIDADTLYFNNTILTKEELLHSWIISVKESWLAKRIEKLHKLMP